MSAFHVGSLWFERLPDGGVRISRGRTGPDIVEAILRDHEWTSVVAAVAGRGDRADGGLEEIV